MTSPTRHVAAIAVLPTVMAVATIFYSMLALLATFVIDDLDITRAELGWVVTVFSVTSALLSPKVGGIADRLGAKRAVLWVYLFIGVGFLLMAGSATLPWLMATAVVVALGQAMANPATNKLIAQRVGAGRRGLVTGVKQSGVQVGTLIAGLTFPAMALSRGWRSIPLAIAVASGVLFVVAALVLATDTPSQAVRQGDRPPLPPGTLWIAGYAFLMGAGGSPIFSFLPLYAQEAIGLSESSAGVLLAVGGLVGLTSRIAWSIGAERVGMSSTMRTLALLAVVASSLLLLAEPIGVVVLWVATVVAFSSVSAWNSVAMLAVITMAGPDGAGRASGVVLTGFLAGLAASPPIFGWSVDRLGEYTPGFVGISILFVAAAVTMTVWTRRSPAKVAAADAA